MRAAISEHLWAYLRQQGRTVLTMTLKPLRGSGGTGFAVLVETQEPKGPGRFSVSCRARSFSHPEDAQSLCIRYERWSYVTVECDDYRATLPAYGHPD